MTYDIFVSYSRKDSAIVNRFVNRFEMENMSVWVDREGIESGDAFKQVIVKAIKESSILVFFSSKDSNASPWTAKEIGLAVNHGKPVIPVKIDNSMYNEEVEFDLAGLDYIDYTNPATQGAMMEKLVRVVKRKQYSQPKQQPLGDAGTGSGGASPYGQGSGYRTGPITGNGARQGGSSTSSWQYNGGGATPGGRKPSWSGQGSSYWKPAAQTEEKKGGSLIAAVIFFTIFGGIIAIIADIILLSNVTVDGVKYHKYNKTARTIAIISLVITPFSMLFWLFVGELG